MLAEVTLGQRIRQLRKERNLTKEQLQEAAGLGSGYLSKLEEKGIPKRPTPETVRALAKALGVTEADLTGLAPVPSRTVEYDDPYPARQQAIALLEDDPKISKATLKALRLEQRADGRDPGLAEWLRIAAQIEKTKVAAERERDKMFDVKPGRG